MSQPPAAPRTRLLCSTGTFSRHPDFTDYRAILEYGPRLPVDGLEVMVYESWYASLEQIVSELVDSELKYPVVHAEKSISNVLGRDDPAQLDLAYERLEMNCRLAREIGAESVVLHLWGWLESDKSFQRNLDALQVCVDLARRHGLDLAVETIPCVVSDPLTRVQQAVEREPRCRVALDTEFLALHGQLGSVFDADWLWRDARVAHVHVKDFDGKMHDAHGKRRYLQPGKGGIDFKRFFAALRAREYNEAVSLESPVIAHDGSVDIVTLRRSLTYIRDLMAGKQ